MADKDYPTIRVVGTDGKLHEFETGWEEEFLHHYARSGNVTLSAASIGIHVNTVRHRKSMDPAFAASMKEAQTSAVELLEAIAWRRAREGVAKTKGVWFNGRKVGEETVVEYSDQLLMFLLKANKPELYGDKVTHKLDTQAGREEVKRLAERVGADVDDALAEYDRIMLEGPGS